MNRFPSLLLVMLPLLSACEATPSTASMELEAKIVPKIAAWSKSGGSTFNLAGEISASRYEEVCVLPEYQCLGHQMANRRVDEYHSSFGKCVPENSSALIFIKKQIAHAVVVDRATLRFDESSDGTCVSAASAVLRTAREPEGQPPIAVLEQQ